MTRTNDSSPVTGQVEFLFGGTFDPVHFGHLAIIETLQQDYPQIPLRLLLCALPPLKAQPQTRYSDRLACLQLALAGRRDIEIDTREAQRAAPSYTVDSLRELAAEFPEKTFILVMGMDSLAGLKQWHQWQALAEYCHLLVFNRPGCDRQQADRWLSEAGFQIVTELSGLLSTPCGAALLQTMTEHSHSSSAIREAIGAKLTLDSLLPQSVIDYIHNHHLYESENT